MGPIFPTLSVYSQAQDLALGRWWTSICWSNRINIYSFYLEYFPYLIPFFPFEVFIHSLKSSSSQLQWHKGAQLSVVLRPHRRVSGSRSWRLPQEAYIQAHDLGWVRGRIARWKLWWGCPSLPIFHLPLSWKKWKHFKNNPAQILTYTDEKALSLLTEHFVIYLVHRCISHYLHLLSLLLGHWFLGRLVSPFFICILHRASHKQHVVGISQIRNW